MIQVEVKNLKTEMYKVRSRFLRLQNTIVAGALMDASEPVVVTAQATAPVRTGQLRGRIGPTLSKRTTVVVGAMRLSRADKGFPYWDRFQERGFTAVGRSKRASGARQSARKIPGKHFLERAGRSQFDAVSRIFAERVFKGFAEIQEAGEKAGIV